MSRNNTQTLPRYREIKITNGSNGEKAAFVIFKRERKLRSHLMEHFIDMYEWGKVWKSYCDKKSLNTAKKQLADIGCPYTKKENIVKRHKCQKCDLFVSCSETEIVNIQKKYVNAVTQVLIESLNLPRFVKFFSREDNQYCLAAFHDRWIKLHGKNLKEKSIYNIKTVFVYNPYYENVKFGEMLEKIREDIIQESHGRPEWYSKESWRIDSNNFNYVDEKKSNNRPPREQLYSRKKQKFDWRKHLGSKNEEY